MDAAMYWVPLKEAHQKTTPNVWLTSGLRGSADRGSSAKTYAKCPGILKKDFHEHTTKEFDYIRVNTRWRLFQNFTVQRGMKFDADRRAAVARPEVTLRCRKKCPPKPRFNIDRLRARALNMHLPAEGLQNRPETRPLGRWKGERSWVCSSQKGSWRTHTPTSENCVRLCHKFSAQLKSQMVTLWVISPNIIFPQRWREYYEDLLNRAPLPAPVDQSPQTVEPDQSIAHPQRSSRCTAEVYRPKNRYAAGSGVCRISAE